MWLGKLGVCGCLAWFGLGLVACGGRTLDVGVYGTDPGAPRGCVYAGKSYADGSTLPSSCFCFCNEGTIDCEAGCTSASGAASGYGGASSNGAVSGYGPEGGSTVSGGASSGGTVGTAGVSSGGTVGAAGASSAGASSGGTVGAAGAIGVGGGNSVAGSAAAGATSTGGSTGTCYPQPPHVYGDPLIDDMEDGNAFINAIEGRGGVWYTYNDGSPSGYQFPTAQQAGAPPNFLMSFVGQDATGGAYVANMQGKGFTVWGAGMGVALNQGCPYDASGYDGIRFYARADQPALVRVMLGTAQTTPVSANGTCVPATTTSCYDDFQEQLRVSTEWRSFDVPYSQLTQQGYGVRTYFDPTQIININFQVGIDSSSNGFSFSVDYLSFR